MSEKILKIVPPVTSAPSAAVVEALEDALERARSGETTGVVLIEQWADCTASWGAVGFCGSYSMLGALQVAQADLVTDHVEVF